MSYVHRRYNVLDATIIIMIIMMMMIIIIVQLLCFVVERKPHHATCLPVMCHSLSDGVFRETIDFVLHLLAGLPSDVFLPYTAPATGDTR